MQAIRISPDAVLKIDTHGVYTRRKEEVALLKFAGKSSDTISKILGCSRENVNKHMAVLYEREGVQGSDNPLCLLQAKFFKQHWLTFALAALMVACPMNRTRTGSFRNTRTVQISMTRCCRSQQAGAKA